MKDFDIDEWEDMLPVERKYEKQHGFGSCRGNGTSAVGVILWVLAMIYIIADAIMS